MGKILILSIGINIYQNLPDFFQLNYCEKDAKLIFDNYSQFNCHYKRLLLNENATRSEILMAIKDLSNEARDDDYIIFNFAGHGFTNVIESKEITANNSFICPCDFKEAYPEETAISLNELKKSLNQIKSKSKLIIFDSCHSGGVLRRELNKFNLREIKIDYFFEVIGAIEGTGIITACDSDESAIEDSKIRHGIFTYFFIETLKEIDSKEHVALFNEVHGKVLEKVKKATNNKQTPQAKGDDEFKIITLPKDENISKKEIDLDITLVPTSSISKASEFYLPERLEELEKGIIQLIQEDRYIELDKIFKQIISTIYDKISQPGISYNAKLDETIQYYESCREYLKPLLIINNNILEYYDEKYITENLEYIFKFEQLTHGKNGLVAIIQIPIVLISEIMLNILPIAYSKKKSSVLNKLFSYKITNYQGITMPLIYDSAIWQPELFNKDRDKFIKYLFPKVNDIQNIFLDFKLKNLNEVNFLFDCVSSKDENYDNYPTYLIYNDNLTPRRIISKLSDQEYIYFIKKVFTMDINDLVNLIIERQKEILSWSRNDPLFSSSLTKSIELFKNLRFEK